ncbi:MAG: hypothetical protein A2V78_02475 [Betaproteobacteria bacterium RBG_16_64_18]|nr:MAG: hypothetical protein A2V78_02475 [Betaproteobacteria bacterium RBG_16_64_18]
MVSLRHAAQVVPVQAQVGPILDGFSMVHNFRNCDEQFTLSALVTLTERMRPQECGPELAPLPVVSAISRRTARRILSAPICRTVHLATASHYESGAARGRAGTQ